MTTEDTDENSEVDLASALAELGEDEDDPRVQISTPQTRSARPASSDPARARAIALTVVAILVVVGMTVGGYWLGYRQGSQQAAANRGFDQTGQAASADNSARIAALQDSLASDPDQPTARLELGLLLFNSGDVDGGKEQWLEVTRLEPDNIEAWYNLGFAYLSQEPADTEAAKEAWNRVVEIDPQSSLAQTVQSHMGALLGDGDSSGSGDSHPNSSPSPSADSGAATSEDGR